MIPYINRKKILEDFRVEIFLVWTCLRIFIRISLFFLNTELCFYGIIQFKEKNWIKDRRVCICTKMFKSVNGPLLVYKLYKSTDLVKNMFTLKSKHRHLNGKILILPLISLSKYFLNDKAKRSTALSRYLSTFVKNWSILKLEKPQIELETYCLISYH